MGAVRSANLRTSSAPKLSLLWCGYQFGHNELSQFGRTIKLAKKTPGYLRWGHSPVVRALGLQAGALGSNAVPISGLDLIPVVLDTTLPCLVNITNWLPPASWGS